MKIIKLDAIDSTNSFLKDLAQNSSIENYTTVVTNHQTAGRGQMNSTWHSEPYKNLTFSVFTRLKNIAIEQQSYLNFAISIAIYNVLYQLSVPNLRIKWPNDIMSGNQKICGILIETTFKGIHIKNTVIGIGLNVNQEVFPASLQHVTSLKNILQKELNLEELRNALILQIKEQLMRLERKNLDVIYSEYLTKLYKKEIPTVFKNTGTQLFFMGIIKGVSRSGKLQIQLEDDSVVEFGIKEISLAKA